MKPVLQKSVLISIFVAMTTCLIGACELAFAEDLNSGMTFDITEMGNKPPSAVPISPATGNSALYTSKSKILRGKTSTLVLEGKIEHSQSLAPVESGLKAGLTFDITNLPKLVSGNEWYQLPDWAPGRYKTEKDTCYYFKELSSGLTDHTVQSTTAIHTGDSGMQTDKLGHVWEYEYAPYKTRVDGDTTYEYQLIRKRKPLELSNDRMTFLYVGTTIHISKVDNKIIRTSQVESIQTYTPAGPNKIKCAASMKIFDENGKPIALTRLVSGKQKIAPYHRIDKLNGKDLQVSFRDFLISHNLEHLMPVYLQTGSSGTALPQQVKFKTPAKSRTPVKPKSSQHH